VNKLFIGDEVAGVLVVAVGVPNAGFVLNTDDVFTVGVSVLGVLKRKNEFKL
jgi:hypothetical protein